jgi:hypothetical protein
MQPELGLGTLQRIRVSRLGDRQVALLDVRAPGETVRVVCAAGMGVGIVDAERRDRLREALRGAPVAPAQALWRARFEGARVRASAGALEVSRADRRVRVDCGGRGQLELTLVPDGAIAGGDLAERGALEEKGAAIAAALAGLGVASRRDALRRALSKSIARVSRRIDAVRGDLARTETADALAQRAQLFVAAAATAPRGADRLQAVDWSTGEAVPIEMPLDPSRGARDQIDALFRRARRLKEGARIGRSRLDEALAARGGLEAAIADLGGRDADLDAIEARARTAAPRDFKMSGAPSGGAPRDRSRKSQGAEPRRPYRAFAGASGTRILVGRGAADNDALTLHVARPHDLWLHAKDRTGAHVIVPLPKGASCPAELLVEAAHLAAHFSDARDDAVVDVQYTPRRYLRKPRGSAPGAVIVDREKVMALRRDDAVLRRLLESEATAEP